MVSNANKSKGGRGQKRGKEVETFDKDDEDISVTFGGSGSPTAKRSKNATLVSMTPQSSYSQSTGVWNHYNQCYKKKQKGAVTPSVASRQLQLAAQAPYASFRKRNYYTFGGFATNSARGASAPCELP